MGSNIRSSFSLVFEKKRTNFVVNNLTFMMVEAQLIDLILAWAIFSFEAQLIDL